MVVVDLHYLRTKTIIIKDLQQALQLLIIMERRHHLRYKPNQQILCSVETCYHMKQLALIAIRACGVNPSSRLCLYRQAVPRLQPDRAPGTPTYQQHRQVNKCLGPTLPTSEELRRSSLI